MYELLDLPFYWYQHFHIHCTGNLLIKQNFVIFASSPVVSVITEPYTCNPSSAQENVFSVLCPQFSSNIADSNNDILNMRSSLTSQ